jgi:hypothetical protein
MPVKHTTPWMAVARRVSGRVSVPTSSIAAWTPSGTDRSGLGGDVAVVEEDVVDADRLQRRHGVGLAGGGEDGEAAVLGQDGGGHPDRGGAAADQQGLAGLGVEADGQRAVGGLDHLGNRAQRRPVELGAKRDHLGGGHTGELGIAAVKGPAHATHHRGDLLALLELASGCSGDDAGGLDAEHAREGDALGEAQPRVQLGAIDPKGLDPDEHPAWARLGDRQLADHKCLGRARGVQHHGTHGRGHVLLLGHRAQLVVSSDLTPLEATRRKIHCPRPPRAEDQ